MGFQPDLLDHLDLRTSHCKSNQSLRVNLLIPRLLLDTITKPYAVSTSYRVSVSAEISPSML
jgi:hypothetical protein